MPTVIQELEELFKEAKAKSELDFVLTLLNYRGISSANLNSNLHEWFDAIEFYKRLFYSLKDKEKTRIGALLYSTFFENSDFYNIIGSLCKIKLGYKGSSYLFWKTKKYERLLGIGEKQDFLIELLNDAERHQIIAFFEENHFKEIRNSFFHSAYSLEDDMYVLHDSEPVMIEGVGVMHFDVNQFFYPKVESVIAFFDEFKALYFDHFNSYKEDKTVAGLFPNPVTATILGSTEGLKGFRIKDAVQFYGEWHDSGIWYDEKNKFWAGHNIRMYFDNIETIEIRNQLKRYEGKDDIRKNDSEFHNMVDKIVERNEASELSRATKLLLKFGDNRREKTEQETLPPKKASFAKMTLPYYRKAREIGGKFFKDLKAFEKDIKTLEELAFSKE